ncbi:MAG: dehydrogenase (quinone) [Clostridiales bacterium]|jgi:multicomponent Na+:H+ antiporter subunit D|nr:dehydrogenase (quinone) [Clostridiales bacterium]
MEFVLDYRPLWAVLISLIAAALIMVSGRYPNLRETWTIAAAVGKIIIVYSMLPAVLSGQVLEMEPIDIVQGISLHLRADSMGMIFAALASLLWLVTSFYSIGYMRGDKAKHQTGYFASFAVCLSATMGIAFAANLITFFVFYEILTIATYPLVIHKRNQEAINGGRKYLAYTLIAGQLFLIGIIWTQIIAPGGEFVPGGFMAGKATAGTLSIIFTLMILGTAVKAGVMPLHGWLPTAMVAPTPVSALLHAVAVVKAGAFGILRIIGYVFGPELLNQLGVADVLAWIAAFTIIVSSLIAMKQDHLKRRLAFSTIGQLSYVVLGGALLTPLGLLGGMYHIVAHAFMKITLFFCAGAIHIRTHKDYISQMRGIGKQMPITMAAFTLASFGIAGFPFIVGFISKWNLAIGALQAGKALYVAVLIGSAMLSTAYLIPVGYMAFFKESTEFNSFGEARLDMLIPIVITAVVSVLLGIFPNAIANFYDLAAMSASQIVDISLELLGGL